MKLGQKFGTNRPDDTIRFDWSADGVVPVCVWADPVIHILKTMATKPDLEHYPSVSSNTSSSSSLHNNIHSFIQGYSELRRTREWRTTYVPEISPEFGALCNFPYDDRVKKNDCHVRDDLHEDHLAPELVVGVVVGVGGEGRLSDLCLVRVRKQVRLEFEKLKKRKVTVYNCMYLRSRLDCWYVIHT